MDRFYMSNAIDANTPLKDVLEVEGAELVLSKYNFPCVTCPMAQAEMEFLKIGEVCETYGIDLKGLLGELNKEE